MNVLEHEEAPAPAEHPAGLSPTSFQEQDRKLELVGVVWQIFRLVLLSWSLLCFYCGLRLCLNPQGVDLASVAVYLVIGLVAWIVACKVGQPMEWFEENDANVIDAVDAK